MTASADLRPGEALGYLGLGSNVGDRRAQLQAAVDALPAHGVRVLASSATYDTDPVGEILDQPSFLNACVRIATALAPEELLDACKAVERERGRQTDTTAPDYVRHGPRPVRARATRAPPRGQSRGFSRISKTSMTSPILMSL